MDDESAQKVVSVIRESASTGSIGDGKIFILAVEEAVRIRLGESGTPAL